MIKEFALDASGQSKWESHSFRLQTRCISALYERCFSSPKVPQKIWKILVDVVESVQQQAPIAVGGVMEVQINGDVSEFTSINNCYEKKEWAAECLMKGIRIAAKENQWEITPFQEAYENIKKLDFCNTWRWKGRVFNAKKTVSAEVFVDHKITEANISAHFRYKRKNIIRNKTLVSDDPSEFAFVPYLGKFHWIDDETVELISRDSRKRFLAKAPAI